MDQTLRNFFLQYGGKQIQYLDKIGSLARQKTIKKGSFLLEEGAICKNFYIVISGSFRLYYLKDGIDTSVWFSFKNNSSIELHSYISQSPSEYYIECIEDAEVIIISKSDIDLLCQTNPTIDALFKCFWQDVVQHLINRLTNLQKYSAEERYIKLIEDTDYLNQIPQKYIASYIGVTTTSLSRIRRKIKTKLS
ncbi:MAG: Crp/Fnr family transcriptional regulator [Cyclobacteriaceae bacterium]